MIYSSNYTKEFTFSSVNTQMDKIKRLSYVPAALSLKHAPSVSGVSLPTSLKRVYVVAQTNGVN